MIIIVLNQSKIIQIRILNIKYMIKTSENGKVQLGNEYEYDPKQKIIGEGSYAKVMKGYELKTGKAVAIKICARQKMDEEETISLEKQIHIMKQIHHPNIVDFYAVYQDSKNIYMVLEFLQGGELYDHILEKEYYSEEEAKETLLPIIDAVRYLHQSGIVHRDLKPQNIVYTQKQGVKVLKIIDFGVSQIITNQTFMSTTIGTPLYMAPQIFMGEKYKGAVDIWSIGVILYVLMCGYPPFQSENPIDLQNEIKTSEISFYEADWVEVSDKAKDLIGKMLERDPAKRITIEQIYTHPWIVDEVSSKSLHSAKIRLHNAIKKIRAVLLAIKLMKK